MLTDTARASIAQSLTQQERIAAGLAALILGAFILYGVGFAHADILHNAAHDTRHAVGFPCH